MNYEEKAFEIIKKSIKSAIFIDENARTFFQKEEDLKGEIEEELSINLYNNLKANGISLDIHKYQLNDENDESLKNYLFEDRDLVLLDWNLQDQSGEEYSLKILEDIINRSHIHFCTIYTTENETSLDKVFYNILSFFSNEDEEYYIALKENLENISDIEKIKSDLDYLNVNRYDENTKEVSKKLFKENREILNQIFDITGKENIKCSLIKASIALMNTKKSKTKNPCPSFVSFENKMIVIENTIITILNKKENNPEVLIKNISKQIINHSNSFTKLLGLEMQNSFSKSSSFIDSSLMSFSKNALLHHREFYKKEGFSSFFPEFIKSIMLEKANLNLRNLNISLLDEEFLDSEYNKDLMPFDDELIAMNVFYNSSKFKNENKLNFGDVFEIEKTDGKEFYICITALCDCLRPDKIDNLFFFAKGSAINKKDALKLGDSAFISYLNENQIVKWTDVNKIIDDEHHKFNPVYIKPLQFLIVDRQISTDGKLNFDFLNSNGEKNTFRANYVTTIKSNYAQRIANHAFAHPVRVGVDFVKK